MGAIVVSQSMQTITQIAAKAMRAVVGSATGGIAVGSIVDFGIHFVDGRGDIATDFLGAFSQRGKPFAKSPADSCAICIVVVLFGGAGREW